MTAGEETETMHEDFMEEIRRSVGMLAEREMPGVWVQGTDVSIDAIAFFALCGAEVTSVMAEEILGELAGEARCVRAARRGAVPVEVAWGLRWVPMHEVEDETDVRFAKAVTGDGHVLVYQGPRYEEVPMAELRRRVAEEELENLWCEVDLRIQPHMAYEISLADALRLGLVPWAEKEE